ncbi:MAG: hypothetical protein ACL93V_10365 [Candidatus Electrothrix sp. YB6]
MSGLQSLTGTVALLLSLTAFAFSASTVSAVDVPIKIGDPQISSAMGTVASSSAVKNVMAAKRDEVVAQKINAKPLMNEFMPKVEAVMLTAVKENVLPEKMKVLQNEMAQKIAPKF